MAKPNGLNPTYNGKVGALGFDATHGLGISVSAKNVQGSTATDFFGTTNGFKGTVTAIWVLNLASSSGVVTVASDQGTLATIACGAEQEVMRGSALLTNTAINISGTMQIVSTDVLTNGATVFIAYKVADSLT